MFPKLLLCVILLAAIKSTLSPNLKFLSDLRWKLSYSLNRFGVYFYHYLPYRNQENIFISPLSITNALNALYLGSRGKTYEELSDVLMYGKVNLTKVEIIQVATMFSPQFLFGDDKQFYVFNTANAILINPNSSLRIDAVFQREIAARFSVAMMNVDFFEPSRETLHSLNRWLLTQTRKIRFYDLDINAPADLTVISSAYLKAAWEYEFSPLDTNEEIFYNRGLRSGAKNVSMMHMTNELNYYSDDDSLRILELPFKDRAIRMFIFLPKKLNGLLNLEREFSQIFLKELRKLSARNVYVSLPKFQIRYSTSMIPSLTGMGATELFNPESVDLSIMIGGKKVVIGKMVHKTFLTVMEGGFDTKDTIEEGFDTKATSFGNSTKSCRRVLFKVNRPFFFIITDRRPRILFIGRVNEL
ncbi:antithrombin-III [Trichonephila clavata]|uniref:Antithrombin-III n=1 Tax=Trichonephila clavata TaxID=2740835 RepID=A0A8X6LX93_TRICU|nr:antithrombin-III [Trichonephila clavata]